MNKKIYKYASLSFLSSALLLNTLLPTNILASNERTDSSHIKESFNYSIDTNLLNINFSPEYLLNHQDKIQVIDELTKEKEVGDLLITNLDKQESSEISIIERNSNLDNLTKKNIEQRKKKEVPFNMKDSLIKDLKQKKETIEEINKQKELERIEAERIAAEELIKQQEEQKRLEKEASKKTYYTVGQLNVRLQPTVDGQVLTTLGKNAEIVAYTYNEEWLEINYNNQVAYVNKKYVTTTAPKVVTQSKTVQLSVGVKSSTGNKVYKLTNEERILLEKLVHAEAGNQSYEGKLAVATVIANRVEMEGSFDNTIHGVVYAKNQFSPTFDGRLEKMQPTQSTKDAVDAVFGQGVRNLPSNVVYFCTNEIKNRSWLNTRASHSVIGDHTFFYNYKK